MIFYLNLTDNSALLRGKTPAEDKAAHLVPVTTQAPPEAETPPSPWLAFKDTTTLSILDLDTPQGREALAKIVTDVPLYRITIELLVDRILLDSQKDPVRMKGVRQAFAPDDAPEAVVDALSERYAFAGVLHFPVIASRTDLQLIELYLKLFAASMPMHLTESDHLSALMGGYPQRLIEKCDGVVWRQAGWVRLDRIIYDAERVDYDPEVTFESYVTRGRAGAEALAVSDPEPLLAAWIQAERVQRELCRDIDSILRLPDIRRLPRWVRADVFRVLEREAMKQVFAEGLMKHMGEWPALRRTTILAEPIGANAKGEVAPLIQQLLNQTLSADARYAGSAEAFAMQAERRYAEVKKLLG